MPPAPSAPADLGITPGLMSLLIRWTPLPWDTVVDHYRVHGVPADRADKRFLRSPSDDTLLAKRVYPFYAHTDRAREGEEWTYVVVTVDAAGNRSKPSAPATGASLPSVTVGRELARLGEFDRRTLELRFAPASYAKIKSTFPTGRIVLGPDARGADLPYLLPGPGDAWAGSKAYTLTWTIRTDRAPVRPALALWLVDTTKLGGTLHVRVGAWETDLPLPIGSTRGSREGDATDPTAPLRPVPLEVEPAPGSIVAGETAIELSVTAGGWVAWDAIGVYDLG